MADKIDGIKLPPGMEPKKKPLLNSFSEANIAHENRKKRIKNRSVMHIKQFVFGFFIVCVTFVVAPLILNQSRMDALFHNEKFTSVDTCTITEVNFSELFDTTCGKVRWNPDFTGTPDTTLVKGKSYELHTSGVRVPYLNSYPMLTEQPKLVS